MKDTASSPSRLLAITAVAARWVLGLLMAAWLLFALSVAVLHGWIVPRIGEYRGVLEAQATRTLGIPVRIGSIAARTDAPWSLFPSLELRDITLHDAQQREALRLARVVVNISPRSLWRLSFEQLYVERPELDIRMDANGKLHVAGLDMSAKNGDSRAADWFFSQREVAVSGGTVRWIDERRAVPPLLLTDVQFVARNRGRHHGLRLDATPPAGWGQRFTLRGDFRQPLLSAHRGDWRQWKGQIYADLPSIDVGRIGRYVALDARVREGRGALRAWIDVRKGEFDGAVADLGLERIDVTLGEKLQPLSLRAVTGRLAYSQKDGALEVSTDRLQFNTRDGQHWPGGNVWFQHRPASARAAEQGVLRADRLDLAMLARIADGLPLGDGVHRRLIELAPKGLIEQIDFSWSGPIDAPQRYQARGRVSGLSLAAQALAPPSNPSFARAPIGRPGLRGARLEFDASQAGGQAQLSIAHGALELPGIFEDSVVPLDTLLSRIQWKIDGPQLQVQMPSVHFTNADAQGEAKLTWRTSDPATSSSRNRFPGVLDLSGKLSRANGTRVYRYLPLDIPKPTRDYVRDAVQKGRSDSVDFRVRGDLHDMPFTDPRQGEFRIAAKVADVNYAYVPYTGKGSVGPSGWPALVGASGDLVFERAGMQVRNVRGRLHSPNGIELLQGEATIADMAHHSPVLKINAQARGPLNQALETAAVLLTSETANSNATTPLTRAQATGAADYRLQMDLPLTAMDKVKLQAAVALSNNELRIAPELPPFTQVRGTLNFTETAFSLAGLRARVAGGETQVEGRGRYAGEPGKGGKGPDMNFQARGSVSAEGLRALREVGWLTRLGRSMNGATAYSADFSVRDGVPEFSASSNLQGMALQLPAPLAKTAEEAMPLHIEQKVVLREARGPHGAPRMLDQISLRLGSGAMATYLRDISGPQAHVIQGALGLGVAPGESLAVPERNVLAYVNLPRLDIDAWKGLVNELIGAGAPAAPNADEEVSPYLPSTLAVRVKELRVTGRKLANVVLGGTRAGPLWRLNIDSDELSGYAEYSQSQAGQLHARLARLKIAPGETSQVASLLDERASTLPALDIVIEDFEMHGKRFGRAEIEAVNRGGATREWRLNRLALIMPEAKFTAQGSWSGPAGNTLRRTTMDFKLDIGDAGTLLTRLGMKDVLARGNGRLEGRIGWQGSPFSIDYPSMDGSLHVDVESGQFLKVEPGLAKLLGVLSLQALPRRLTLDFRDVFSQGFAFDFVRGDARIDKGVASTNNLQMKGVSAAALLDGEADIARETQNLRVVVVPEINAGTAALVAAAINPAIGLGTFIAQLALRQPLITAATQEFQIDGTWADPKITKVPRRTAKDTRLSRNTEAPQEMEIRQ